MPELKFSVHTELGFAFATSYWSRKSLQGLIVARIMAVIGD